MHAAADRPVTGGLLGWLDGHPRTVDVVGGLLLLVVTFASLGAAGAFTRVPWTAVCLLVLTAAAIPLGRLSPELGLAAAVAAAAVLLVARAPVAPVALVVVAAVAQARTARRAWVTAGAAVLLLVGIAAVVRLPGGAVLPVGVLLVGMLLGSALAAQRRYVGAIVREADALRHEQEQRAAVAVAEERARIAREMHDVVAHGLSVVIRLADGIEAVAEHDSAAARVAAGRIAGVGRDALADMRRVLGLLSTEADDAPQPALDDLTRLVDDHRAAGLPVRIARLAPGRLTDGMSASAFRILQECLTNAARYALDATEVVVDVSHDRGTLILSVEDDGRADGTTPSVGAGRGLVGIRERAAICDGTVEAGPVAPHGWRVRVVLRTPSTKGGAA